MSREPWRLIDALPLALAGALVLWLAWAWSVRIPYPYDLEWMEGGMLVHAWRLRHGLPLYVEPGADFIPFIYPPGMASVLAALGWVVELGAPLGRGVSLAGTLAAAGALVVLVGRHGRSWALGLAAAAVFLGAWPESGAFYDLVRNDGLLAGLLAWSVVYALDGRRGTIAAAGLLLAAAFTVKQNAALYGFAIAAGLWMHGGWREAGRFALWSAVPALAVTLWLQWTSGGLFLTYILGVPAAHPMVPDRVFPGFLFELGGAVPVALGGATAWLVWWSRRDRPVHALVLGALALLVAGVAWLVIGPLGARGSSPWQVAVATSAVVTGAGAVAIAPGRLRSWRTLMGLGLVATAVVSAWLMRGHHGGFLNVYVPLHWFLALAFGVALARTRDTLGGGWGVAVPAVVVSTQLGLQLHTLSQTDLLPTELDRKAGDALVAQLAEVDGPVWAPYHSWLPVQAGHAPAGPHLIALWDIDHEDGPLLDGVGRIQEAVADQRWAAILVGPRKLGFGTSEAYTGHNLGLRRNALVQRSGWRAPPKKLLTPRLELSRSPTLPEARRPDPLDRREFWVDGIWRVVDLERGRIRWDDTTVSASALADRVSGTDRVWLRAAADLPARDLEDTLHTLGRAGVATVALGVRGPEGEGVLELPTIPRPTDGVVDAGMAVVTVDPATGRVRVGPFGAPMRMGADVTVDVEGLTLLWHHLGGPPPRLVVTMVPEACDVACAVRRLEAARAIPTLEDAALAVGTRRRPADELTPVEELEPFARKLEGWDARPIRVAPPGSLPE